MGAYMQWLNAPVDAKLHGSAMRQHGDCTDTDCEEGTVGKNRELRTTAKPCLFSIASLRKATNLICLQEGSAYF